MKKPFYKSKTLWFNVVMFLLGGISAITETVPASWLPYIGGVTTIGNLILRLITTQGVSLTRSSADAEVE